MEPGLKLLATGLTLALVPPLILLLAPLMLTLMPFVLPFGVTLTCVAIGRIAFALSMGQRHKPVLKGNHTELGQQGGTLAHLNSITAH